MRVIFIRHGESIGNIGVSCDDLSQISLTDRGHAQAVTVARGWTERPTVIAVSSYLRTYQTAAPTIQRFPDVPVEVLPMQEFTYLEPGRWRGTSRDQRLPHIEAYWKSADPDYSDGPGAESFSGLLHRVDTTLALLEQLDANALVFAFSHGQFMQALRISLLFPCWSNRQKMEYFWHFDQQNPILNADFIETARISEGLLWTIEQPGHLGPAGSLAE